MWDSKPVTIIIIIIPILWQHLCCQAHAQKAALIILLYTTACMSHVSWHVQSYYVSSGGVPGVGL